MSFHLLATATVLLHGGFVLFVVFGAAGVLRYPRLAWLHLPAALWGALVELAGWPCPLTSLEVHFRHQAGLAGYSSGFIDHYVMACLYPPGLTRAVQVLLGAAVLVWNLLAYGWLLRHRARQDRRLRPPPA